MSENRKGILVVALTQRGALVHATYELLTVGQSLAERLQEPLCAAALGAKASAFGQDLVERGAQKVFAIEHPALEHFTGEGQAKAVADLVEREKFCKILLPSTVAGRTLAALLAVRLRAGLAVEVSEVHQNATGLKAKRTQYSGNVIAELEFKSPVQIVTVQGLVYPRAERQAGRAGEIVNIAFEPGPSRIEFVSYQPEEAGEVDLGNAERVISGGRGLGNAEGFKLIRELAHAIGAAVGASRAVVDSGWIPYRHQVGLTGRSVRPKLYVACGISGQIQHLAGMASSGTVVAINTDPECPMMQMATVSVAGDLYELIPLIINEIRKRKGTAAAG